MLALKMDPDRQHLCLHYTSPASKWAEALPLGNGRLGCMVHGRTTTELLQLNEDSVWYGGPRDRTPQSAKHLPLLRQFIRDGCHQEAEQLVREEFFSVPTSMSHYEPLGTAYVDFGHESEDVTGYRRWLDIGKAVHSVTYDIKGVTVNREVIASYPDDVLVMRITASKPVEFAVRLSRRGEHEWDTNEFLDYLKVWKDDAANSGHIEMGATTGGSNSSQLCCVLGVQCDPRRGSVQALGTCVKVKSSESIIVIGARTTYRSDNPRVEALADVSASFNTSWENLLLRHVADYQTLFDRTALRLWPDHNHLPTNTRITQRDPQDIGLVALYHNYGKYLLIASSRPGPKALPANLQGMWNPSLSPPWGSRFTININIQMNYWPVALCDLHDCALPLVELLEHMANRGKRTAELMYGCRGWCCHHNTDLWGDADPQDTWMPATLWPLGGVWLCIDAVQMLQHHYDENLHKKLFPLLEGCIEFLEDFLVPSVDGKHLVTSPSLSPENTFITETGELGIFCEGSAMDMTIVTAVFELYLWSVDILGEQPASAPKVKEMLARTPPLQINAHGLIQEWGTKDYEEHEPGHRHISHLFGLFPGDLIDPTKSPELAQAAQRVLQRRAAHGGGHTGWSRAWLLNMHARLRDADGCGSHIELLLSKSTLPNLLDNHPPFQIDGNFGGCAGIVECLVQSSSVGDLIVIHLLPACPVSWARGELNDICLRGGWRISFQWTEGKVVTPVRISARADRFVGARLVFPDEQMVMINEPGRHVVGYGDDNELLLL